jgi:glucokinase
MSQVSSMAAAGNLFLGIEIGGTKLQLAVGHKGGGRLTALERHPVDPSRGAAGILEQIEQTAAALLQRYELSGIGIGFGGPVDAARGRVIKSHQIDGWEGVELGAWCEQRFRLPTRIGNDCDAAALAEATYGAGRRRRRVFYVTVGTGVGGGLVVDGHLQGQGRPAVAEIGHLRPGLHADRPEATVEAIASGRGIEQEARTRISGDVSLHFSASRRDLRASSAERPRVAVAPADELEEEFKHDLLNRADGYLDGLTTQIIAQAASEGNRIAADVLHHACQVLGWAIAQAVTLLAPEVVVIGGGVSLMGEEWFFQPVREAAAQYVFPPLRESYRILPAALGEEVVVYGAIALAASADDQPGGEFRQ